MSRGIIPFILTIVGLSAISFALLNPLFDWQITEVTTDPAKYKVRMSSSTWTASWGEILPDKSYISRNMVVWENNSICSISDLDMTVNRSQNDELVERLFLTRAWNVESKNWITLWLLFEIALSVAYSFWFMIWQEHRPISHFMIFGVFLIISYCFILMPTVRVLAPTVGLFTGRVQCQGTVIITAKLVRVYYWVPLLLLTAVFAELVALVMMVRKIIETVSKRKESSEQAVG